MADINFDNHPQFLTATLLEWKPLLATDDYKDIIINSLLYLRKEMVAKYILAKNGLYHNNLLKEKWQLVNHAEDYKKTGYRSMATRVVSDKKTTKARIN